MNTLGINLCFVNSKNGNYNLAEKVRTLWQNFNKGKTAWTMTKLKLRYDCVNQIFNPNFSSFWQVLHDIITLFKKYWHILHHLQIMKMIFSKLFLICTCNDPNMVEKLTNLAENLLKSWTPWSLLSLVIRSLPMTCDMWHVTYDMWHVPWEHVKPMWRLVEGTLRHTCSKRGFPQ